MNLSAPTQVVFWISLIIAIVAVIAFVVPIASISPYAFWLAIIGYIVLAVGCVAKGL